MSSYHKGITQIAKLNAFRHSFKNYHDKEQKEVGE